MYTTRVRLFHLFSLIAVAVLLAACVVQAPPTTATANQAPTNAALQKIYAQGYFT